MKKALSVFLALVMLISVASSMGMTSLAFENISEVKLYNGNEGLSALNPAVGRRPSFNISTSDSHVYIDTSYSEDNYYAGIRWYDGERYLNSANDFIAGKDYTLSVVLACDDEYLFKVHEGRPDVDVEFSIDNEIIGDVAYFRFAPAASVSDFPGSAGGNKIIADVTFTCGAAEVIESLNVGMYAPVLDDTPFTSAISNEPAKYKIDKSEDAAYLDNTVRWHCVEDNKDLTADDTFERGKHYIAYVRLIACDGYEFKNVEGPGSAGRIPDVTVTFGGNEAVAEKNGNKPASRYMLAHREYFCTETVTEINMNVDLSDYKNGGTPEYYATSDNPDVYGYAPYLVNKYVKYGVNYYCKDTTGHIYPLEAYVDTFTKEFTYELTVAVEAYSGYEFAFYNQLNATINGMEAKVSTTCPVSSEHNSTDYRKMLFLTVTLDPCTVDINDCDVIDNNLNHVYNGKTQYANISVYDGSTKLRENIDYEILYMGDHTNAGTVNYEITGLGKYSGSKADYFVINKKKVSKVLISANKYTYDGKVHKPTVKVYDGSKLLKNNTDYTVKYSNANPRAVGNYSVTVTPKGNYTGAKTIAFSILPKGTTLLKTASTGKDWISPQWKKQTKGTTGYEIMYSTSAGFRSGNKTATVTKNTQTVKKITGLKKNKKYYFKIRTYKTVKDSNGRTKKVYSANWSPVKAFKTKK